MAASTPVPDLVKLSKLATQFHSDPPFPPYIQHTIYAAPNQNERRRVSKEERWIRKRNLGRGSYGTVWLEQCFQGDKQNELRAVKGVPKHVSETYNRELEAIALFSHENYEHCFVKSFGWYEDETDIFIAMEFFPQGDLSKYLGSPLPEQEAQDIAAQILEGLQFMHDHHFVHRDLKPDNILIACKGPNWWVKIADFGISKRAAEGSTGLRTAAGTPAFSAPEVFQIDGKPNLSYTDTVDIWSLSVMLFLILTGKSLFKDTDRLKSYTTGDYPFPIELLLANNVSGDGCNFVQGTMQPRPELRPRTNQCRQHLWVQRDLQATRPSRPFIVPSVTQEPLDDMEWEPSARWTTRGPEPSINALTSDPVPEAGPGLRTSVTVEPDISNYQPRSLKIRLKGLQSVSNDMGRSVPVAFSPTGEQLATGCQANNEIMLWDFTTGKRSSVFGSRSKRDAWGGALNTLAYSPDGKHLASGSPDGKIELWDVCTTKLLRSFSESGYVIDIKNLVYSPNAKQLASSTLDQNINLWDPSKGTLLRSLRSTRFTTFRPESFSYSPNGKQLASISSKVKAILVWNISTSTATQNSDIASCLALGDLSVAIAYSPDGRQLLSALREGIKIWNSSTQSLVTMVEWPIQVRGILNDYASNSLFAPSIYEGKHRFSPNGEEFVVSGRKELYILNSITGELLQTLHGRFIDHCFSWDGQQLALREVTKLSSKEFIEEHIEERVQIWAPENQ